MDCEAEPTETGESFVTKHLYRTGVVISSLLAVTMSFADAQALHRVAPAALAAIVAPPLATPPSGSSQADVTVVEYFDYNCPVCRGIEPQLRKLVGSDPKVRLIHKDWPVFGDASVYAAYCSFAAARDGKYALAHDALIGSKQDLDSKEDVRQVLRGAGFDLKKIDADIALHEREYSAMLARNQLESAALGLRGTPGLIVGDQLVPGGLDYPQLQHLVSQARQHP
jgi:protein-disulfide isomerase